MSVFYFMFEFLDLQVQVYSYSFDMNFYSLEIFVFCILDVIVIRHVFAVKYYLDSIMLEKLKIHIYVV